MRASKLHADLRAIYEGEVQNIAHSLRRLGARDPDLEDLTQEVFVRAFQQLASFDRSRPIRPWLFGIAYRVFCESRRKVRRLRAVEARALVETPDAPRTPERAAELTQSRGVVLDTLEELAPERRAVFVMYELNGDSMAEIAEALEVPLFTAYSRLRAARAQFASLVARRRQDDEGGSP